MLAPKRQSYLTRSAVTVVAGGASFGLTNMFDTTLFAQLSLSIFVGGFFLLVQLLTDVEHRLNVADEQYAAISRVVGRQEAGVRTTVREGFSALGEATALLAAIRDAEFQPKALLGLVERIVHLDPKTPPLVVSFLHGQVEHLSKLIEDIGRGTAEYEGEDRDWLLGFTRSAASTIDAVSLRVVDSQVFWGSELGSRYLNHQREAIERGVGVRRVFVFDQLPGQTADGLQHLFAQHANLGIEVRVLLPDAIPGTMKTDLRDFIVFDSTLSYESTPANHVGDVEGVIQSTRVILQKKAVDERRGRFEDLWQAAEPYHPRLPGPTSPTP